MNPADVDEQWTRVRATLSVDLPELIAFLDAARRHPNIAGLFPFRAMHQLCFSRCSRFPYFVDYFVHGTNGGQIILKRTLGKGGWVDGHTVSRGEAATVAEHLAGMLPANYGPAFDCTGEDVRAEFERNVPRIRPLADLEA